MDYKFDPKSKIVVVLAVLLLIVFLGIQRTEYEGVITLAHEKPIYEPGDNLEVRVCGHDGSYRADFGDWLGFFSANVSDNYPKLEELINSYDIEILAQQSVGGGVVYAADGADRCVKIPGEEFVDFFVKDLVVPGHPHYVYFELAKAETACSGYPGGDNWAKFGYVYRRLLNKGIPSYSPEEIDDKIRWMQSGGPRDESGNQPHKTVCLEKAEALLSSNDFREAVTGFSSFMGRPIPDSFILRDLLAGPYPLQGVIDPEAAAKNIAFKVWYEVYVNEAKCLGLGRFEGEKSFVRDFRGLLTNDIGLEALKPSVKRMDDFFFLLARSVDVEASNVFIGDVPACHDLLNIIGNVSSHPLRGWLDILYDGPVS